MKYKFVNLVSVYAVIHPKGSFTGSVTPEEALQIETGELSYTELLGIFNPVAKEIEIKKAKREELLDELPEIFKVVNDRIIVIGIDVGVPKLFLEEYKKAKTEQRKQALINFWSLACLNPDTTARDGLFNFVKESGLYITDKGYLIAYRGVKILREGNRDLFVAMNREVVKRKKQKKGLYHYYLIRYNDGSYNSIHENSIDAGSADYGVVGKLDVLYNSDETDETVYTWAFQTKGTGVETNEIKIGVPFTMDREQCDPDPSNDCSRGLHFTSWDNLGDYAIGDKVLAILVNPMHTVAVPFGYAGKKARCCEYIPVAEVTEEITTGYEPFEQDYEEFTLDQINDLLDNSDLEDGEEIFSLEEIPEIYEFVEPTLDERQELLEERYSDYYDDEEEEEEYYREDDDIY